MNSNNIKGNISFNFFLSSIKRITKKYKHSVYKRDRYKSWIHLNVLMNDLVAYGLEHSEDNTVTLYTGNTYRYCISSKYELVKILKILVSFYNDTRVMYEINKFVPLVLTFPIIKHHIKYFINQLNNRLNLNKNIVKFDIVNDIQWNIFMSNKFNERVKFSFKINPFRHLEIDEAVIFFENQYKYISDIIDLIQGVKHECNQNK